MAAVVDKERQRQMKIKTGVVKRLTKEKGYYQKEFQKETEKAEKMKSENKDEYDIRQQEKVAAESKQMIPDCHNKLKTSFNELSKMIESESDLSETEEYKQALVILEDAKKALED